MKKTRTTKEEIMASLQESINIPGHVPDDLVWDRDYSKFAAECDDPFRRVGELHSGPDIIWATHLGEGLGGTRSGWLPTRFSLMREVLSDTEHFRSGQSNMMGAIGLDWKLIPLEFDPPQQQLYRKVLEPFFSPAGVDSLDGAVRQTCDRLIERFGHTHSCEFSSEFSEQFPSHIFLDLMGMPKSRLADFLTWERGMLRPTTPDELVVSMTSILRYLTDFVHQQRDNPTSSLMKSILSARYENHRPLTANEIVSICYLLYIGGLDTVYSTLGWIFWHLARDQAMQERLRENPADIPRATEELLRAFSVASTNRYVFADMDFHGVRMRAGDVLHISLPLAARDPKAYEDPHTINIDRQARHIAFGIGPHTCLGLRLAKREIKIVLEAFLSNRRNIRIPENERHDFHTGTVFGIDRLPLEWESG
jgi:cytochrome P450